MGLTRFFMRTGFVARCFFWSNPYRVCLLLLGGFPMRSFWLDPYLWVHVAGLAALPIFLEICLLGLAAGYPLLPAPLELLLIAAIAIGPIFWMQWQRPFYIFSLLLVALKPNQLTETQRRMLRFFRTPQSRAIALVVPLVLLWVLWQIYRLAPLAADVTPIPAGQRIVGLGVAAIAFLLSNLFLQVPASVLRVLLVSDKALAAAEPYPVEQIAQDFTLLGLQVNRILPELVAPTPVAAMATTAASSTAVAPEPAAESPESEAPETVSETEADTSDSMDDWVEEAEPLAQEGEAASPEITPDTSDISDSNAFDSDTSDIAEEQPEASETSVEPVAETEEAIAADSDEVPLESVEVDAIEETESIAAEDEAEKSEEN